MSHRVVELHNIMPIVNIPSVLQHGILSHEKAAKLNHCSVAMAEIQERRDKKQIPQGLKLHQYANLYFDARNPMLFKRRREAQELCILRVSKDVLNMKGVVLTDRNASCDYVQFLAPHQIEKIDFDAVFAKYWTDVDGIDYQNRKAVKCAEVLVPHRISPELIFGAYVTNRSGKESLELQGFVGEIIENSHLFFL